jgi:hypothetical protein
VRAQIVVCGALLVEQQRHAVSGILSAHVFGDQRHTVSWSPDDDARFRWQGCRADGCARSSRHLQFSASSELNIHIAMLQSAIYVAICSIFMRSSMPSHCFDLLR